MPLVGLSEKDKENFSDLMDEVMQDIPNVGSVMIQGDISGRGREEMSVIE